MGGLCNVGEGWRKVTKGWWTVGGRLWKIGGKLWKVKVWKICARSGKVGGRSAEGHGRLVEGWWKVGGRLVCGFHFKPSTTQSWHFILSRTQHNFAHSVLILSQQFWPCHLQYRRLGGAAITRATGRFFVSRGHFSLLSE